MSSLHIPQNYDEWRYCITVICGQPLTAPYIDSRIAALNSATDHMTKRFGGLYGEQQRLQTLTWFERAKNDL